MSYAIFCVKFGKVFSSLTKSRLTVCDLYQNNSSVERYVDSFSRLVGNNRPTSTQTDTWKSSCISV